MSRQLAAIHIPDVQSEETDVVLAAMHRSVAQAVQVCGSCRSVYAVSHTKAASDVTRFVCVSVCENVGVEVGVKGG